MTKQRTIVLIVLVALMVVAYTQLSLFVIPPIGAVPEGRTLVIARLQKSSFVDSPDAMCERLQGGVNLLCRGAVLGAVADNATVLLRLPYSAALHRLSTGGKSYQN